jgi:hypothetical protein
MPLAVLDRGVEHTEARRVPELGADDHREDATVVIRVGSPQHVPRRKPETHNQHRRAHNN